MRAPETADPRLSLARRLIDDWGLRPDGAPFATEASLLWPVARNGRPLMLKLPDEGGDEAGAAGVLRLWRGKGAARLLATAGSAQLLERLPGPDLRSLVAAGRDDEAADVIGGLAARLHEAARAASPPPGLLALRDRGRSLRAALAAGAAPDPEAAEAALDLLARGADADALALHGDLHHGNILGSPRGWLAIDPKGLRGAPAYDLANALCNPWPDTARAADPKRMARQAERLAARTGHAPDALLGWAFAHGMMAAAWDGFGPAAAHWLACARTARALGG